MDLEAEKTLPRRGRPGDVRMALLQAAIDLNGSACYPTLREIIRHARVGRSSGRYAVQNMRRNGLLVIVGDRRVSYRNRRVAEYAAACPVSIPVPEADFAPADFSALMSAWS